MMKKTDIHYSAEEEEEEELDRRLAKTLTFQKHKYKSKSKTSQRRRNQNLYDSDSEVDSEEEKNINGDYFSTECKIRSFQTNLSKYQKEEFGKTSNNIARAECNTLKVKEHSVAGKLKNAELQRISDNGLNGIHIENEKEAPRQSSNAKKVWLEEQHLLEINGVGNSFADEKENYIKEEEAKYSEDKPVYSDTSYDNVHHDTFKRNNTYEGMKSLPSPERKRTQNSPQQNHEKATLRIGDIDSKEAEYILIENSKMHNQAIHNSVEEYSRAKIEEMSSTIDRGDEEALDKNYTNIETQNKLNASLEVEDINRISNNTRTAHQTEQNNDAEVETMDAKQTNDKKKIVNYNKEKLLATMKAIDDNENIEFLNQGFRNHNTVNRMQITENLYRGLPTHSKPKRDVIRDIFEDNHVENKAKGTCSKSH